MNELFDMGGYELYVWGSMAASVIVFAWNVIAPAWARRALLSRLRDQAAEDGE